MIRTAFAIAALATASAAFAQASAPANASQEVLQRQANQQQRIDNGLKDGSLSTREAARLEKKEAGLDRTIARDEKNGLTPQEAHRINQRENALSRQIHAERHDAVRGDPNSASSRRMQADVQRNANQDRRMAQGAGAGQLSPKEVSMLERGQAHVDTREARAGADGHVGAREQARVQHAENRQSRHIHHDRAVN
jgi:hypothetical protein